MAAVVVVVVVAVVAVVVVVVVDVVVNPVFFDEIVRLKGFCLWFFYFLHGGYFGVRGCG